MKYIVKRIERKRAEQNVGSKNEKIEGWQLTIYTGIVGEEDAGVTKIDSDNNTFIAMTGEETPAEREKMIKEFADGYVKNKYPDISTEQERSKEVVPNQMDVMTNYYAAQKKKEANKKSKGIRKK